MLCGHALLSPDTVLKRSASQQLVRADLARSELPRQERSLRSNRVVEAIDLQEAAQTYVYIGSRTLETDSGKGLGSGACMHAVDARQNR